MRIILLKFNLLIFALFLISSTIFAQEYISDVNGSLNNNIAQSYFDQDQEHNYSKLNNSTLATGDISLDSIVYLKHYDEFTSFLYVGIISYTTENRLNNIKWDEINYAGRNEYKTIEYTYTPSGKLSTKYIYYKDNQWRKVAGEEYFYNQNDSIIQHKTYTSNDGYKLRSDRNFIYDSLGNLTEQHNEWWSFGNSPSYSHSKEIYSYNQNNLLLTDSTFYLYDSLWIGYRAEVFNYQNQYKTRVLSNYNGGWEESYKYVYSYNQMNLVDTNYYYRKSDIGKWYLYNKIYYNYTSNGFLLTQNVVSVNNDGTDLPLTKQELFYTSNDVLYESNQYKYDTISQLWELDWAEFSILDPNENVLLNYAYLRPYPSSNMDTIVRSLSVYDINVNTASSVFPIVDNPFSTVLDDINANSNNLLKESTVYSNSILGSDSAYDNFKFYYSGIPTAYEELSNEASSNLYPNPAENQITIELEKRIDNCEINIYNVLGQIMIQKHLDGNIKYSFDISELKSGIYFYSIVSEGKVLDSAKFIKQ